MKSYFANSGPRAAHLAATTSGGLQATTSGGSVSVNGAGSGEEDEAQWDDAAVLSSSCRALSLVFCKKAALRACVAVLLAGGLLSGAMRSTIFSLEHHDRGEQLDVEISPVEERVVMILNLLGSLVFAVIMGKASDDNNRKVFVMGGLMIMVLAAGLGASAVGYQTDTGFRRGELFVASIISGVGSSTIYCAALAAVYEQPCVRKPWRAVAIGACRCCWECGRALGSVLLDPIGRNNEMLLLLLIALFGFMIGLQVQLHSCLRIDHPILVNVLS